MIYSKVLDYCEQKNLSIRQFEQKCGLANGTVHKWKNGGNPSLSTLLKIENYTRISAKKWLQQEI